MTHGGGLWERNTAPPPEDPRGRCGALGNGGEAKKPPTVRAQWGPLTVIHGNTISVAEESTGGLSVCVKGEHTSACMCVCAWKVPACTSALGQLRWDSHKKGGGFLLVQKENGLRLCISKLEAMV